MLLLSIAIVASLSGGLTMDYDSPACTWNEALPIGNGRNGRFGQWRAVCEGCGRSCAVVLGRDELPRLDGRFVGG